jgi:hypothetical protein
MYFLHTIGKASAMSIFRNFHIESNSQEAYNSSYSNLIAVGFYSYGILKKKFLYPLIILRKYLH